MGNFTYLIKTYKKVSICVLLFIAIVIVIVYCLGHSDNICGKYDTQTLILGEKQILAQIADDHCKKELGLSGRSGISEGQGILFVFDSVGNYGFWMKDMNFSIDIIWLDQDFKVVGIEKSLSPSTFPKVYGTVFDSKYVLEVSDGFVEKNSIKVGNIISIVKK
jgi:uncharacterized membrane protein (UPF0127 family)